MQLYSSTHPFGGSGAHGAGTWKEAVIEAPVLVKFVVIPIVKSPVVNPFDRSVALLLNGQRNGQKKRTKETDDVVRESKRSE